MAATRHGRGKRQLLNSASAVKLLARLTEPCRRLDFPDTCASSRHFLLARKSAKNHWISWHCPFNLPPPPAPAPSDPWAVIQLHQQRRVFICHYFHLWVSRKGPDFRRSSGCELHKSSCCSLSTAFMFIAQKWWPPSYRAIWQRLSYLFAQASRVGILGRNKCLSTVYFFTRPLQQTFLVHAI